MPNLNSRIFNTYRELGQHAHHFTKQINEATPTSSNQRVAVIEDKQ